MQKLLTGRWLARHVLVLLVFVVLVNLGLWQLRRLEQRRTLNADILAGLDAPPVVLTGEDVDPQELRLRRVAVTGVFDNPAAIAIRGRSYRGQPGVHLVTPLQISGSNRAVLVDRGWIPLADARPEQWQPYAVTGTVTVKGIAYPGQSRPEGFFVPTDPTPEPGQHRLDTWFRVDIDRIQQQIPYPLLPIFIEQSPAPDAATAGPPFQAGDPTPDEGPHLGYALQWFSFALVLLVLYGVFIRQNLKRGS